MNLEIDINRLHKVFNYELTGRGVGHTFLKCDEVLQSLFLECTRMILFVCKNESTLNNTKNKLTRMFYNENIIYQKRDREIIIHNILYGNEPKKIKMVTYRNKLENMIDLDNFVVIEDIES